MTSAPLFPENFLRRLEGLTLAARRAMNGQTQGERRSPRRGQSVEFADFRPYSHGDDFRRIDWNAYARLERFFIKLFVEEEDLTVHFLLDASRSMDWGEPNKLQYARQVTGALGYVALSGLDRVTVNAFGADQVLPAVRGKRQALTLFDFLQKVTAPTVESAAPDPTRWITAYAAAHTRPGLLVLLSDLMNDGWMDGLRLLAARGFEVNILHILAPQEIFPQWNGDLKLIDLEDGAGVDITADYDLLARYQQNVSGWQAEWRQFCAARGMGYVPVQTTLPLDELLFAWMQRQGVLR